MIGSPTSDGSRLHFLFCQVCIARSFATSILDLHVSSGASHLGLALLLLLRLRLRDRRGYALRAMRWHGHAWSGEGKFCIRSG